MVDKITKEVQEKMKEEKKAGRGKGAAAANEEDEIDHASYHDAPVADGDDEGYAENDNLSLHDEHIAMDGVSGDSGADEDYSGLKSDEEEESGKKKKKHDKDKKSKKIKKEKKDKKHKKDKKKHKKHHKHEGGEDKDVEGSDEGLN
jgi:hypothetical protein